MPAIKGVWKNPTKSRCDLKRAYPSMDVAESRANRASRRAGHLIRIRDPNLRGSIRKSYSASCVAREWITIDSVVPRMTG